MVIVAYYEALEPDVMEALATRGVTNYTKLKGVLGKGTSSGPHFGDVIWPMQNHLLLAAVEDEVASAVLDAVRGLRKTVGHEGVKAFVLPIEAMT